jgi:hypothetical protein
MLMPTGTYSARVPPVWVDCAAPAVPEAVPVEALPALLVVVG